MTRRAPCPSPGSNRPDTSVVRAVLLWVVLAGVSWACAPGAGPAPPREAAPPRVPAAEPGAEWEGDREVLTSLLAAARDSLETGAMRPALELAEEVLQDHAGAPGSARALGIAARALLSLDRPTEAAQRARRYAGLLGPDHPYFPGTVLLEARARRAAGLRAEALASLLALPAQTPDSILEPARDLARQEAEELATSRVEELALQAAPDSPLRGILATALATELYLRDEVGNAREWAQRALASQDLPAREEERVRGVLEGTLEEILGLPVILGAVLPRTGASPTLLEYGAWMEEGIQVALQEMEREVPPPVQLQVVDSRGNPLGARTSFRSLEGYGALGAVGPVTREVLLEIIQAREDLLPVIAPFASMPLDEAPGVFSLSGPDPGAARQVARYARELGLDRVAILRPRTVEARVDAESFLAEFQELGGTVPREIVYDSGATFFEPQFQEVEATLPDGLFLPLGPEDVELLAPQFTFFGMDTLGVQVLGTSGWTEESVVQGVDTRHTDGVIATTTRPSQEETEAHRAFRQAYEGLFRKTLRSDVPAYGHDAAALFLRALAERPRTPEELVAALHTIRDFPGATGDLTVEDGWILRESYLVRLLDRELIYISGRFGEG